MRAIGEMFEMGYHLIESPAGIGLGWVLSSAPDRGKRTLGSTGKMLSPDPRGEDSIMAFIASPSQLKILKQVVDDYCRDCGIVDGDERLYVAELVSSLFETGALTSSDLRRGLEVAMGRPRREA